MSLLIGFAGGVIKAVSGARMASRVAGHDTPVLDELHDGLSPARSHARVERVHALAANAGAGQTAQPTAPGDTVDGDPTDADNGPISDAIQWFTDLFN